MKKVVLTGMLSLLLLTGCGSTQKVECTMSKKSFGVEMNTVLDVELQGSKFKNLDMTIEAVLPESAMSNKELFIDQLETQYAGFESQYGAQPKVEETDNGAKIKFQMSSEQAEKFYGNTGKVTKKEVIEEFEKQGFECK